MALALIDDPTFDRHDTGPEHPERPARLQAVRRALDPQTPHLPFACADRPQPHEDAPRVAAAIRRVHQPDYIERLRRACERGERWIDTPDSAICPDSERIARRAVAGVLRALDALIPDGGHGSHLRRSDSEADRVFCAVRPPGHHAEADRSMGFCLYANVAIAAFEAIESLGFHRVAIVDFDVHHGNGTQHAIEREPRIRFFSLHQDPRTLYPGTGFAHETGCGNVTNVPLPPGSDDVTYRQAIERQVTPGLRDFAPDLLLFSAGFDAAEADPLANQRVSSQGFFEITRDLVAARVSTGAPIVSVLEGGYDLDALESGVSAHLAALDDRGS